LNLWSHTPVLTTEGFLTRPPTRATDLDLHNPTLVTAYQEQLLAHLPTQEVQDPHNAGAALLTLSTLSASVTRDLTRPPGRGNLSRGKTRFDGWSPVAISLKANLTALVTIDGHLRGHRTFRRWSTQAHMDADIPGITTNWTETVRSFTWADPETPHQLLDITGYGPSFWRTTPLRTIQHPRFCQDLIRQVRKLLHGRHRCTLRSFLSAKSAEIEQSRLQGKIGQALRSVLQEDTPMFTLESLHLPDQGILSDHRAIHNTVTDHFRDWYTPSTADITDWPLILADAAQFHRHTAAKGIPNHLSAILWSALTEVPQADGPRRELTEALAHPPTLEEFRTAIQDHKASTSPGASGLTYNMARAWPPAVTLFAHNCLTQCWNTGQLPAWMQWGWLCPKPKDPEAEVTLQGLRPLILLEVLRKIWVGIIVNKITSCWDKHGTLSEAQHGFRHRRGTDSALLQFINAREHSEASRSPLFTSSWDIRRAFDSVPRSAMEISWTRLGVPPTIAAWIAHMDTDGRTAIRSPWALHTWATHGPTGFSDHTNLDTPATFNRGMGTPQGDVSSPHNWAAFFDILLVALARAADQDPDCNFLIPRRGQEPYSAGDIGFADDLTSTATALRGLQIKADVVSAFTILFGLTISAEKLRVALFSPPPGPHHPMYLTIHGPGWSPTQVEVRLEGTIRMLGVTFDIAGPQTTQLRLTKTRLARSCAALQAQRNSDHVLLATSTTLLPRALYTALFLPLTSSDLQGLDVPANALLRRHTRNMPCFPNALLYLPATYGGLGLPRLSTSLLTRKWAMIQRAATGPPKTQHAIDGLLHRAAVNSGSPTDPTAATRIIGPHTTKATWGSCFGHHAHTNHPLTLQQGSPRSLLDEVLSSWLPMGGPATRILRTLCRRGLHTWADLTYR
ncbi:MAG: hypothetical protein CGW95_00400, partial [Phenylobacterium zucineum]